MMSDPTEHFNHAFVEAEATALFEAAIGGGGPHFFPSHAVGVIAFERLDTRDEAKVDWDRLASDLSEKAKLPVVCIANCDWSFDDSHDEEATFIAFDVPGLDETYNESGRNKLSAPAPGIK